MRGSLHERRRPGAGSDPDRRPAGRRPAAGRGARRRRRGRRRGHPPAAPPVPGPRGHRPAGRCSATTSTTRPSAPPSWSSGCARAPASGRDRRRDAVGVRPRLPAGQRRGRGRRAGHLRARADRGAHGARRLRAAGGPVLLRGVPPAQGRGAGARRWPALAAERRTMVFFEAPHRLDGHAARDGRGVRGRPAGRRLPRADQDLRGGPPRGAGRAGGLGGRGRARRDHRRGRRCDAEWPTSVEEPLAGIRSGSPRASGSRTSAPTSPRPPACRRRRCTTRRWPPADASEPPGSAGRHSHDRRSRSSV